MPPQLYINTRNYNLAMAKLASKLGQAQLTKVTTRSINYALAKASTQFKREARKEYNINASTAKDIPVVKRATYSKPEGSIDGSTRPLSLSRFNPRQETATGTVTIKSMSVYKRKKTSNGFTDWKKGNSLAQVKTGKGKPANKRTKGVSVEVFKGERKIIPFAFMQQSMKNNGANGIATQIWARSKKKYSEGPFEPRFVRIAKKGNDNPIVPLKTTSALNILTNVKVIHPVHANANEDYKKEFIRLAQLTIQGTVN